MPDKATQKKDEPPALKLEDHLVPIYEMRNLSEILRDWLPELLPWRKKKRKLP